MTVLSMAIWTQSELQSSNDVSFLFKKFFQICWLQQFLWLCQTCQAMDKYDNYKKNNNNNNIIILNITWVLVQLY